MRALLIIASAAAIFLWTHAARAELFGNGPNGDIQKRLDAAAGNSSALCSSAVISEPAVIRYLYASRNFKPAWIDSQGPLPQADALLNAIQQSDREGLKPQEYHFHALTALLSEWQSCRQKHQAFPRDKQIDLEFLLTDALFTYGSHLLNGRVEPEQIYPDWFAHQKENNLLDIIENAMNTGNVEAAFQRIMPQDALYRGLKQTLAVYMNIARTGGWPLIPPPGSLKKKADHAHYLSLLRQHLFLTGDFSSPASSYPAYFDEKTKNAVRRFQKRHALKADGVINQATLREINIPVEQRIRQITLNLERLRWLPAHIERRHILVNIADFMMSVFQDDQVVMDMPVVVGKQKQRTSVFSGKMTHIELNPYWNVPKTIAAKEILPEVQKDPLYLTKKKLKVLEYRQNEEREIDPATVDWSKINPDKLRYSFRQDLGPGNALGRIKFLFPNKFEIYLHDTPERHLFHRTQRTFSHGCIRIAKPIDLAEYLLKDDTGWNRQKILAEIAKRKRQVLRLKNPIEVHILYLTAWTDRYGDVQFRKDIYDGDPILFQALTEKPRLIYPVDINRFMETQVMTRKVPE